ncbi:hypothetical protein CVIRNUC_005226 [Coccomyxa viridis]|uniref:P25-alpha family protein n=1 Tax=Coccomyxa viridis TaxID=1274662 RepID=A0AAV1I4J5_9CHLO|nr:hypothetical protein CVIRNUC_005226 [Coccomyxa viridis]
MQRQTLQDVFKTYAGFGTRQVSTELDGAKFVKVFKDAGLVGKDLSTTELDIIFSKVKAKSARKITFPDFERALELIATKKGCTVDELKDKLCSQKGPKVQATQPDYVKFHDDKSTYTGVYANGGPTNVDGTGDLSELCDRTPADNRGVKM